MITRLVKCLLTVSEITERGRSLAKAEGHYADVESEKDAVTKQFKRDLDSIGGRIGQLSAAIRDEAEMRDVECLWENDFVSMTKRLRRTDTGDIVETAVMSEAERQGSLL